MRGPARTGAFSYGLPRKMVGESVRSLDRPPLPRVATVGGPRSSNGRDSDHLSDENCGWSANHRALARTTDVSICLAGIDQYVRSRRSLSPLGTTANPFRR